MDKLKQHILNRINPKALDNTGRSLLHVASDLINASDKNWQKLSTGTFLSVATLKRVALCVEPYHPQADTIERILKYFGVGITCNEQKLDVDHVNQPKRPRQ